MAGKRKAEETFTGLFGEYASEEEGSGSEGDTCGQLPQVECAHVVGVPVTNLLCSDRSPSVYFISLICGALSFCVKQAPKELCCAPRMPTSYRTRACRRPQLPEMYYQPQQSFTPPKDLLPKTPHLPQWTGRS